MKLINEYASNLTANIEYANARAESKVHDRYTSLITCDLVDAHCTML